MEKIRLSNGKWMFCLTEENDTWKFFSCPTYGDAVILKTTLTDLGNYCEIDDDSHGWYVRVKK